MRITSIKQSSLAAACALALCVLSGTAVAQQPDEKTIVTDTSGSPVKSSSGECVHSTFGPTPLWTMGCHPYLPAQMVQYVAPAAAPYYFVAAAAVTPAPAYEKVAFNTNIFFDSDRSALRQAGRDSLDEFVRKIQGLEAESITATGYSDRMGDDAVNQALSQKRVDSVKAYLVAKGIASHRVLTGAKGESRPSTFAGECKDANTVKNVACMQSDRHVYVEVSGTRIAKE